MWQQQQQQQGGALQQQQVVLWQGELGARMMMHTYLSILWTQSSYCLVWRTCWGQQQQGIWEQMLSAQGL